MGKEDIRNLLNCLEKLDYLFSELIKSRRWKIANLLGDLYLKMLFKPSTSTAEDFIKKMLCQIREWRESLNSQHDNYSSLISVNSLSITKMDQEINQLKQEIENLKAALDKYHIFVPPGHFYSPLPSLDEVRQDEQRIFGSIPHNIPGVNMNIEEQLSLLNELKEYYNELPFKSHKTEGMRYFFENPGYSYSDAIFLYSMIRHTKPKKIIEVGCGYSSCVILDTNELFFDNSISCVFIDPHPQVLYSLIKDEDKEKIKIIPKRLQDMDLEEFSSLKHGDILFIDSTHVSKINSDVNQIFFKILPILDEGVYIHFHDIFYPFEYPKEWIYEGKAWNESYLLHAFLQYNESFRIVLFNTFLEHFFKDIFMKEMPLCMKNPGGSIWIRKSPGNCC